MEGDPEDYEPEIIGLLEAAARKYPKAVFDEKIAECFGLLPGDRTAVPDEQAVRERWVRAAKCLRSYERLVRSEANWEELVDRYIGTIVMSKTRIILG
jgi:hypothetical protein